ncbi:class I SAM-dependent RNA methyltransferase [Sandarakinorhabdus limnophila]|uniref:class I SAM-dependent RNA methyltransferase n=1 Tax=Sandarakinorhabdus limnophila TaxID=210512 RepID=UPI0026ECAD59|nr:class I SAM-dependent RNA methyltransferase [Sandarakinorhabdus limnophila]
MSDIRPIVRLAARGDGVSDDGRFVPLAAVGDSVDFSSNPPCIIPGPHHAAPSCAHYPECGGCQMQHMAEAAYRDFVIDRLSRVVALPADVRPIALSPPRSRRRASLKALKRSGKLVLGFHSEGTHALVDIADCPVLAPEMMALLGPLRVLLRARLRDGQGAGIALTLSDAGVDVLLANVSAEGLAAIEALTNFADKHDLARLSVEGPGGIDTLVERRQPVLNMGGVAVPLPVAPFLQATREGEAALVAAVREAVGGAARVADLFCGLGTFALPLSQRATVLAVDAAGPAVMALGATARSAGRRVEVQHRDLFRRPLVDKELAVLNAVVFDPPRAGAEAQAKALAASPVPVIVAVSCNPNSFGRDAKILMESGYRLTTLWPVAQFRWSSHVELVARFERQA